MQQQLWHWCTVIQWLFQWLFQWRSDWCHPPANFTANSPSEPVGNPLARGPQKPEAWLLKYGLCFKISSRQLQTWSAELQSDSRKRIAQFSSIFQSSSIESVEHYATTLRFNPLKRCRHEHCRALTPYAAAPVLQSSSPRWQCSTRRVRRVKHCGSLRYLR